MKIGNPGAGNEFNGAVYDRGAMTLQALRTRIGNRAFFTVMRTWARTHKHGNASIRQFINLSERVSGKHLELLLRRLALLAGAAEADAGERLPARVLHAVGRSNGATRVLVEAAQCPDPAARGRAPGSLNQPATILT